MKSGTSTVSSDLRFILLFAACVIFSMSLWLATDRASAQDDGDDMNSNDGGPAQDQYTNDESLQNQEPGNGEPSQCPSAETLATLSGDGDSPVFTLTGNSLLFEVEYDNDDDTGAGVDFSILTPDGEIVDSVTTPDESGNYELRSNVPPGSYFVEATTFGGSYEATVFGCGGQSGGNPGDDQTDDPSGVVPGTIPDKPLANTGGEMTSSGMPIMASLLGGAALFGVFGATMLRLGSRRG